MVAIKDMEMPSCCAECNLEFVHDDILGCCVYQGFDDENKDRYDKRLPNCPLVEIQQSEDCVSRQAVLNSSILIELDDGQRFESIDPEDVKKLLPVMPVAAIANIKFDKEDLEKIIAERLAGIERKKGKWINGHCSICGCDVPAYIIDWKWKEDMNADYCPKCGSEMEGSIETSDNTAP